MRYRNFCINQEMLKIIQNIQRIILPIKKNISFKFKMEEVVSILNNPENNSRIDFKIKNKG